MGAYVIVSTSGVSTAAQSKSTGTEPSSIKLVFSRQLPSFIYTSTAQTFGFDVLLDVLRVLRVLRVLLGFLLDAPRQKLFRSILGMSTIVGEWINRTNSS